MTEFEQKLLKELEKMNENLSQIQTAIGNLHTLINSKTF